MVLVMILITVITATVISINGDDSIEFPHLIVTAYKVIYFLCLKIRVDFVIL